MALGVVTPVAIDAKSSSAIPVSIGDLRMTVTQVVGEASYTTGGPSITAQQLGFNSTIYAAEASQIASTGSNATSAFMSVVVAAGGGSANLLCFTTAGVQITSATNVSGYTWQIIAFGI